MTDVRATGRLLKRAQYRNHRAADRALAEVGTTLVQWDALRAIDEAPDSAAHALAVTTFQSEYVIEMKQGQTTDAGGYSLTFDGMQPGVGPNYTEDRGHFTASRAGVAVADVWSSKRIYTAQQMPTTEAGILTFGLSQLYVSLGDATNDGGIVVRIWWKPFILCIWGGAIIMSLGGLVSLSDRRLRVGAPSRKKAKPAPRPVMEPAE